MQRHNFYFDEEEARWLPEREVDYWDWRLDEQAFMPSTITKQQYLEANAIPARAPTRTEVMHNTRPARVIIP